MNSAYIMSLILTIAADVGIPPYFALAVAYEESGLNPNAVGTNYSKVTGEVLSYDRGVMQLNSRYFDIDWQDPETNIRTGIEHLKALSEMYWVNTYWALAVVYNCGYARFMSKRGAPESSVEFANRVMLRWKELEGLEYINPVIKK